MGKRAVFLDRDGTIIHEAHYLSDPAKVRLYRGAGLALRKLKKKNFELVVISNQSAVGRGWVDIKTVDRINRKMSKLLVQSADVNLDAVYYCPHAPNDGCACRKPKTVLVRMAQRARAIDLRKSYMIGDKLIDIALANRAGLRGIFVLTGHGRQELPGLKKPGAPRAVHVARNILSAAGWILREENRAARV
ncbi:MAG: HAD family hydrolase [Elusimicrobia bacterium]|nr:HAD family hydrolase [Elusimicrobiota bacterium]